MVRCGHVMGEACKEIASLAMVWAWSGCTRPGSLSLKSDPLSPPQRRRWSIARAALALHEASPG